MSLTLSAYTFIIHNLQFIINQKAAPSELAEGAAFSNAKRGGKLVLLYLIGSNYPGAVGAGGRIHLQGSF